MLPTTIQHIDPSLLDVVLPVDEQGYPEKLMMEDRDEGVLFGAAGEAARTMPDSLRIPQSRWREVALENDRNGTWPMNYIDRFTNQQPTHECTCHSLRTNFEGARNRHRAVRFPEGPKKDYRYPQSGSSGSVWFSAMYPYNKANPGIRGGAGVRQVLEIIVKEGMMPDKIQPREYNFPHTMPGTMGQGNSNQSSGKWISYNNMPEGWRDTAKHFKPLEIVFPESWEDAVSLVLNGFFVSVGRNGHAIPWGQWLHDKQTMAYPDSYNVIRYDSLATVKRAWQGSFAIITTTQPGDWLNPLAL